VTNRYSVHHGNTAYSIFTSYAGYERLPEPEAGHTPSSLSILRGLSTPEVSHWHRSLKPQLEAEQSDAVALDSPEEGKGFHSSWEINVKKVVGQLVM
jgi:hypothetical protein